MAQPRYIPVVERVTCTTNLGCELNLRKIALEMDNVVYIDDLVTIQLRSPHVEARVSSTGVLSCDATNEKDARIGVRRIARKIQKMGFEVRLGRIVVKIVARCIMPFQIILGSLALARPNVMYEPELNDVANVASYKMPNLNAPLFIHSNGTIEITAPTLDEVTRLAEDVYHLVSPFRRL